MGRGMNAPPRGCPSLNLNHLFLQCPVRSTAVPSTHCINSASEDPNVFYHIQDVFVSSGLASANKPRRNEQWSAWISQSCCMTHAESVDVHTSNHYYLPPYKSHSIKTAAVPLGTSVSYKKTPALTFFKRITWIGTSLLFRGNYNTQISLCSYQKHEWYYKLIYLEHLIKQFKNKHKWSRNSNRQ